MILNTLGKNENHAVSLLNIKNLGDLMNSSFEAHYLFELDRKEWLDNFDHYLFLVVRGAFVHHQQNVEAKTRQPNKLERGLIDWLVHTLAGEKDLSRSEKVKSTCLSTRPETFNDRNGRILS